MHGLKYKTKIDRIKQLTDEEKVKLNKVTDKFAFRANDYYLSLIDWNDPNDPIRRIVIPDEAELDVWGQLDASHEADYTVLPGLEHKYNSTVLLLVNDVCGAYCRFCFRKRLFMEGNDEVHRDVRKGVQYIREHKEVSNVLLTGGDPLVMSTNRLEKIVGQLRDIDHVRIIRIGTKIPAINPYRIIEDPTLLGMIRKYSTKKKRMYIVTHFNHPRELTDVAIEGIDLFRRAGAILVNQTPLLRGINDDPIALSRLFNKLSYIGVPPYYVFQCRPTLGNKMYSVPLERGYKSFEQARMNGSGLAKRARFVMSHTTGKIEVIGLNEKKVYFKYHRAHEDEMKSGFLSFERNAEAHWFDDYKEAVEVYQLENPFIATPVE